MQGKRAKEEERNHKNNLQTMKKMAISTYLSVITLNVNGLNTPVKRHRVPEWIQKQDPYVCCLQETHFRFKEKPRLK